MLRRSPVKLLCSAIIIITGIFTVVNYVRKVHRERSIATAKLVPSNHFPQADLPPVLNALNQLTAGDLRQKAADLNFQLQIHNRNVFGEPPVNGIIAVVQVHSRIDFFEQLLKSLEKARGIESVTLVISMDKFDQKLLDLVATIKFCRYITIFFPFSMQLYPDRFPGEDPNDCPRDIPKAEALLRKCNNAEYPDKYGHYREVKYVQIKHHWLWKLHTVFNGLKPLAGAVSNSSVLLLEEDYYVLPDVFEMAKLALASLPDLCPRCKTISLGNYEKTTSYNTESANVHVKSWVSSKNNIGMVITKGFYKDLVSCNEDFCSYDDYNWDWTLQATMPRCMGGEFLVMAFSAARVLHIGTCRGIHTQSGQNCEPRALAARAVKNIDENVHLYPGQLRVATKQMGRAQKPFVNGGWGDDRDHKLCMSYYNLSRNLQKTWDT